MLLLETSNKINRDRIRGILKYERLYGPWRLHIVEGKRFEQPVADVESLGVNGILAGTTLTELLPSVMQCSVPTVFFDAQEPSQEAPKSKLLAYSSVTCDNRAVGRFGARYFLKKSFGNFAYVHDIWNSPWSIGREEGFCEELAKRGESCSVYRVSSKKLRDDWSKEQKELAEWLKALPKPVAVLAASDARGRRVLDTCEWADLCVPEDVVVLGVDNDELICSSTNPPMSSILRDTEGGGYRAAELLDRLMRGKSRRKETILYGPVEVVERLSTESMQFNDWLVVKAVEFIRINSGVGMGVEDVVRRLGVSRRLIEMRFRKATGHSIRQEIQNARLAKVSRLLRETNLSIGTIAEQCGFGTDSYLGLVFRRSYQMSMTQYRRDSQA